jgi:hypothetical protein
MPGPVITTLLSPNPASGNTTPSGLNTETTLASASNLSQGGTFMPQVDLSNMADGDILEVRIYNQANGSSSLVQQCYMSFANTAGDPLPPLPATLATVGWKLTISQTAGTARSYQWSVLNLNGT